MSKLQELIRELCPDGVEYKRIQEVAEVGTGSCNGNEAEEGGAYPFFVRSQNIKSKNDFQYDEEAIIIPGEGGIGDIFHYVNGKYALHQRVYRIHFINESINVKFIYYYMRSNFKSFILKKAVSATVTSIRKPMIEQFEIPVPPLSVQEEIVRILDHFTNLAAELQAELQARKEQYEYYRNKLLAFDKTGKGTQNVTWMKMSEIASFTYGYTDKALKDGDTRFIRITDIMDNGCLTSEGKMYINLSQASCKYLLKKGDLLMARTGATFGKTLYFNEDYNAVYASFLIKIQLNKNIISNKYYWHFSKSKYYWLQANKLASKGSQPQFNANVLSQIEVPIPPLSEQQRIVSILDKFEALVNDLTEGLPVEIAAVQEQYEYYRNKLLSFPRTKISA